MIVSDKQISVAINFLFPSMSSSDSTYYEIEKFIRQEYINLGTAVLYYRNKEFMELLDKHGVSIGSSEVIIAGSAVRATKNYSVEPKLIFEEEPVPHKKQPSSEFIDPLLATEMLFQNSF